MQNNFLNFFINRQRVRKKETLAPLFAAVVAVVAVAVVAVVADVTVAAEVAVVAGDAADDFFICDYNLDVKFRRECVRGCVKRERGREKEREGESGREGGSDSETCNRAPKINSSLRQFSISFFSGLDHQHRSFCRCHSCCRSCCCHRYY